MYSKVTRVPSLRFIKERHWYNLLGMPMGIPSVIPLVQIIVPNVTIVVARPVVLVVIHSSLPLMAFVHSSHKHFP